MIRGVVTFPGDVSADFIQRVREQLAKAHGSREWLDIILSNGGTYERVPRTPAVPAIVRRAWALHR